MINHSPHFSVHNPREWFPNCFGPCPTVNSQPYYTPSITITVKHLAELLGKCGCVCQLYSMPSQATIWGTLLLRNRFICTGHSTVRTKSILSTRGRSEGQENLCLPVSPRWRLGINDSTVFRWAQWSSFSLCAERLMTKCFCFCRAQYKILESI